MKTQKVALSSVAKIIMGTSPKGDTYNNTGNGLPLINGPTEFGDDHPDCTLFTTKSSKECNAGDLIFCVRGSTTGRMNWADKKYSLGRGVCSIRGNTQADTIYIRYCIEQSLNKLLQFASGATFPNLTKDTIFSFKIPYPNDRERIVDIVQKYDTLANTNRRRIQLLEESARLLFREWFVYFRFPLLRQGFGGQAGHEKVKIIDGVPGGWEKENIFSIADVNYGKNLPTNKFTEEGEYPVYGAAKIIGKFNKYTKEKRTIIAGCRGSVGQVTISRPKSYITNNSFTFEPKNLEIFYWLYFSLDVRGFSDVISGTAQPQITLSSLSRIKLLFPNIKVIKDFELKAASYFNLIFTLEDQNQKLAQARDLLLPRLMSGAIEV